MQLHGETVAHFDRHIAAHLYTSSLDFVAPMDVSRDADRAVVEHQFMREARAWTTNCGTRAAASEAVPHAVATAREEEDHVAITRSLLQWIRDFPNGQALPTGVRWQHVRATPHRVVGSTRCSLCALLACVPSCWQAGLVVVSGASQNHLDGALCLLRCIRHQHPDPSQVPIVFYDLGLTPQGRRTLLDAHPSVELRTFPFALFPSYFDISVAAGQYAWKAWCIVPVVTESAAPVLWYVCVAVWAVGEPGSRRACVWTG